MELTTLVAQSLPMDPFDLIFVVSSVTFNLLLIGIFAATRLNRVALRNILGVAFVSLGIPFCIVFIYYILHGRDIRTILLLAAVLVYVGVELLLEYVLKIDFRRSALTHIPYIVLEYVALFSLIAISFSIDRTWGWIVSISFWAVLCSLIFLYWGKAGRPAHNFD